MTADDLMSWAGALFVSVLALGGIVLICCGIVALITTTLAFVAEKLRETTDVELRERNQQRLYGRGKR